MWPIYWWVQGSSWPTYECFQDSSWPTYQWVQTSTWPTYQWVQDSSWPTYRWVQGSSWPTYQWVQTSTWPTHQWVQDSTWPTHQWVQDSSWPTYRWVQRSSSPTYSWVQYSSCSGLVTECSFNLWIAGSNRIACRVFSSASLSLQIASMAWKHHHTNNGGPNQWIRVKVVSGLLNLSTKIRATCKQTAGCPQPSVSPVQSLRHVLLTASTGPMDGIPDAPWFVP